MTVAVAHSDTARGRAALRSAAAEALLRGEKLAVLRIVPGMDRPTREDPALIAELTAELADFSELTFTVRAAPEKFDTADALLDLAEEVDASLLVIGSRRRRPIGKLVLGSTVQQVLLKSLIPVLVVKASSPTSSAGSGEAVFGLLERRWSGRGSAGGHAHRSAITASPTPPQLKPPRSPPLPPDHRLPPTCPSTGTAVSHRRWGAGGPGWFVTPTVLVDVPTAESAPARRSSARSSPSRPSPTRTRRWHAPTRALRPVGRGQDDYSRTKHVRHHVAR